MHWKRLCSTWIDTPVKSMISLINESPSTLCPIKKTEKWQQLIWLHFFFCPVYFAVGNSSWMSNFDGNSPITSPWSSRAWKLHTRNTKTKTVKGGVYSFRLCKWFGGTSQKYSTQLWSTFPRWRLALNCGLPQMFFACEKMRTEIRWSPKSSAPSSSNMSGELARIVLLNWYLLLFSLPHIMS